LEYVAKLAKKEFNSVSLGDDVEDLTKRLFKVISDSIKISEHDFDPEMTADLTYQVSIGYVESPDLRITWLENLVKFHKEKRNFEEAAQCKFCIAALIIDYINLSGPSIGIPRSSAELSVISPTISKEPGLPHREGDEGLYNSSIFSEEGLVETLAQAVKFLKISERYETCIDVYNILLEIHQSHRDYQKLAFCFRDLKIVCDALVASNNARSRLFSIFYRVGFYGAAFGELNGRELIYKEPAHIRLAEFTQRLQVSCFIYALVHLLLLL
jgi:dedicator of cytokinesis protein 6/7/8